MHCVFSVLSVHAEEEVNCTFWLGECWRKWLSAVSTSRDVSCYLYEQISYFIAGSAEGED